MLAPMPGNAMLLPRRVVRTLSFPRTIILVVFLIFISQIVPGLLNPASDTYFHKSSTTAPEATHSDSRSHSLPTSKPTSSESRLRTFDAESSLASPIQYADPDEPLPVVPPPEKENITPESLNSGREAYLVNLLQRLAPSTKEEPCIDDAGAEGQCRSAVQAAGPIQQSFEKYYINAIGEKAAVLTWLLYASSNFKYDRRTGPLLGVGTRNMQSAGHNTEYAHYVLDLPSEDVVTNLHRILQNDDLSFGSAAWWLSTICPLSIRSQLQEKSVSRAAFKNFAVRCVGLESFETYADSILSTFDNALNLLNDLDPAAKYHAWKYRPSRAARHAAF